MNDTVTRKIQPKVYRLQLKTSPNGPWRTIQTGRNREKLSDQMAEVAGPFAQARLMLGSEQLDVKGGM